MFLFWFFIAVLFWFLYSNLEVEGNKKLIPTFWMAAGVIRGLVKKCIL